MYHKLSTCKPLCHEGKKRKISSLISNGALVKISQESRISVRSVRSSSPPLPMATRSITTTTDAGNDVFETPILDDELPNLLQSISEEGGYAYVRMSTLAAAGDIRAAEAAREMAWEQLHSGPWHSVLPIWRDAFSMACLHVAKFHFRIGEYREALRALDLGLIMGGMALREDLNSAVVKASEKERAVRVSEEVEGSVNAQSNFVNPALNVAEYMFWADPEKFIPLFKSWDHKLGYDSTHPLSKSLEGLLIENDWVLLFDVTLQKIFFYRKSYSYHTFLPWAENNENEEENQDLEIGTKKHVLQGLPTNSLSRNIVKKRSALSMEGFLRDYFLSGSPVILSDSMAHWPAITKWNDMDYLRNVAGCRTVPVEVGKNYLSTEWKQELITFSEFLERMQCSNSAGPTYLAQHPLFEQIEELRRDIVIPDYCYAGGTELRSLNAWFGPAGTVTPLHHDPHHNILAQVVGKKYIRLYPASVSKELYPHSESMLCNSSQVDLDKIDEKEFPDVRDLEFVDCVLEEGEMLYIPPRWWHYVRSLTTSFSVSFWWTKAGSSQVS